MDTTVIAARLQKLDNYVKHLRNLQQAALDEYLEDANLQAIVERRLQLAIQACMDIASYLIAQLGLTAPDEPENVFAALGRAGHSLARSGRENDRNGAIPQHPGARLSGN